ncbi:hypothetical protein [Stenotrophomonas koreensis]|nr:hypothetical protein [Stenotrophomonas koreensis]
MSKHTPGPWFHDGNGNVWRRDPKDLYQNGGTVAGDKSLATIHKGWHHDGAEGYPVEANARLIAAAPELLETLEGFVACWDTCASPVEFAEKARAAIAKARGEA